MRLLTIDQVRARAQAIMDANILSNEQDETSEQKRSQEIANWIFAYCRRILNRGGKRADYQNALQQAETKVARSEALRT